MAHGGTTGEASPYDVLGLPSGASFAEIRARFRELARECHPDVVPPDVRADAHERFISVREAYRILSDPQARRAYEAQAADAVMPGAIDLDDLEGAFDEVQELLIEADTLLAYGRVSDAAEVCQRALAMDPENGQAQSLLKEIRSAGAARTWTVGGTEGGQQEAPVIPRARRRPFEPLVGSRSRQVAFALAAVGAAAALVGMFVSEGATRVLGLPLVTLLCCGAAACLIAFAADLAALVRPLEAELMDDDVGWAGPRQAPPILPLLVAAGAVHVLLAGVIYTVSAALSDRWSLSMAAVLCGACGIGALGIATDPGAWEWGVAFLGNVSFLGAMVGWFAGGFLRATHWE